MSSVPIYVIVPYEEFVQAEKDGDIFEIDASTLYEESDYPRYFGKEDGAIVEDNFLDTEDKRKEAANKLGHILGGRGVCHTEGDVLVFEDDAIVTYAQNKLVDLKALLNTMTPREYLGAGEYQLRQMLNNESVFVYPCSEIEDDGCYFQTLDSFMINHLGNKMGRKFVVTQILYAHC